MLASRVQHVPAPTANDSIRRPSWEDQIVPTLKKRLETESAYIANRLSASQFDENPNNHNARNVSSSSSRSKNNASTSTSPRQYPSPTTFPSQIPVASGGKAGPSSPPQNYSNLSSTARPRTKSGPMDHRPTSSRKTAVGLGIKHDDPHRQRDISAAVSTQMHGSDRAMTNDTNTDPTRSRQTSVIPPDSSPPQLSSRIPTRPRSKSQLGPRRPSPTRTSSNPPPLPSSSGSSTPRIPVLASRTSSSGDHPSSSLPTTSDMNGITQWGRASPDLDAERMKEALVKNELPPFRVLPEEALRIAERGHDLDEDGDDVYALYGLEDDEGAKRKRAVTMRGNPNGDRQAVRPVGSRQDSSGSDRSNRGESSSKRKSGRPSTAAAAAAAGSRDLSRSTTEVGLGHPSRRLGGASGFKPRSASGRPANGLSSSATTSFAPRSASLNLLASSPSSLGTPNSRLGVAAHLIPPESSYTPPKGTNWDDVVLPAVAKKLGMADGEKGQNNAALEENFAVEWDKDGTPIRWVKRKVGKLDESSSTTNTENGLSNTPNRTTFSPSFEPSPENPMHQPKSSPLRYQRSQDGIELGPVRTSSARSRGLGEQSFSTAALGHNPANQFDQSQQTISRKSSGGLSRKPSSLLKRKPSNMSRQESSRSLRNPSQSISNYQQRFGPGPGLGMTAGPPPTPGTTHNITDMIYANNRARREGSRMNVTQAQQQDRGGSQRGAARREADTHGKGCGCVIM